jgi:hypothetical protein
MQELQVGKVRGSAANARTHVIDFDVSPVEKERSTPGTPPLLPLEQDCDPAHGQRMLTQPLGPVHDVAVERASGAAHFHVTLDGCVGVLVTVSWFQKSVGLTIMVTSVVRVCTCCTAVVGAHAEVPAVWPRCCPNRGAGVYEGGISGMNRWRPLRSPRAWNRGQPGRGGPREQFGSRLGWPHGAPLPTQSTPLPSRRRLRDVSEGTRTLGTRRVLFE